MYLCRSRIAEAPGQKLRTLGDTTFNIPPVGVLSIDDQSLLFVFKKWANVFADMILPYWKSL